MLRTVFAGTSVAVAAVAPDFLSEFKIVKGSGSLHGLTNAQYVLCNDMTYAEGRCAENNQIVGGYKSYDPDDGRNLRERGFVYNTELDVPAVEVRGRSPK